MSDAPNNPYAFPRDDEYGSQRGMTLRDYFAGQAISHSLVIDWPPEDIAKVAYSIADAMLGERDK